MFSADTEVAGDIRDCRPVANMAAPWAVAARWSDLAEGRLSAGELPAKSAPYLATRVYQKSYE
jgi:hypothetical protein